MKICILSCLEDLVQRDTGASNRIYYLAKNLAHAGNEVNIVIPGNRVHHKRVDGVIIHSINGVCPDKILRFFSALLGVLRSTSLFFYDFLFIFRTCRVISKSSIVQIEQPWAAGLMIPLLVKIFKKLLIVDSHDVFQALRIEKKFLRKVFMIFVEKMVYKFADIVLVVSEEEKKSLVRCGVPKNKIVVIPNGVNTEVFTPLLDTAHVESRYNLKDCYKVVFIGNMEYLPNQEAVREIALNIAPKVQSKITNVKFIIVGRVPPKFGFSNLIFTGVVENVADLLAFSNIAIAPLFHGSGTRLKILEYFSCGLPVVSTTCGVEGLGVNNGVNVLIEDDMDKFAMKVADLLSDRVLSANLGKAAREFVVNNYDWRIIGMRLNTVYHNLFSKR